MTSATELRQERHHAARCVDLVAKTLRYPPPGLSIIDRQRRTIEAHEGTIRTLRRTIRRQRSIIARLNHLLSPRS